LGPGSSRLVAWQAARGSRAGEHPRSHAPKKPTAVTIVTGAAAASTATRASQRITRQAVRSWQLVQTPGGPDFMPG
jgi:hypothetical protein